MNVTGLSTGTVVCRVAVAINDGDDAGDEFDTVAPSGWVYLKPRTRAYSGGTPLAIVVPDTLSLPVDEEGWATVPDDNGNPTQVRDIPVPAIDGVTWQASFNLTIPAYDWQKGATGNRVTVEPFDIPVAAGETTDIAEYLPLGVDQGTGATWVKGERGTSISGAREADGTLILSLSDGTTLEPVALPTSTVPGPQGAPGPANTLSIGTVTTTDGEGDAQASLSGGSPGQQLNLVLPRGPKGNDGAGLPPGGSTGQVPARTSDGGSQWVDVPVPVVNDATATQSGLMPAADKDKLDKARASYAPLALPTPDGNNLVMRDASGRAQVNNPAADYDIVNKRALDAAIPQKRDLIGTAPYPMVIAHRGGANLYPEESVEAMREMSAKGFPIEVDVQALSTGELVCIHDSTLNRTMTGATGNVNSTSLTTWRKLAIKPAMPGGRPGTPMTFDEYLDQFGGRVLLVPEIKTGATAATVTKFSNAILNRGLERAVIVQSFDYDTCVTLASRGLSVVFLFGATIPPVGSETAAQSAARIKAAGIWGVGPSLSIASASVLALRNAGLKVIPYTASSRANAISLEAMNVDGHFSDDPVFTSGRTMFDTGGELATGYGWPGYEALWWTDDTNPTTWTGLSVSGGTIASNMSLTADANYGKRRDVFLRNLGKVSQSAGWELSFDISFFHAAASATTNIGLFAWANSSTPEAYYYDKAFAGQYAYACVIRRNGTLQAWEYVNGAAAVSLGSNVGSVVAADGKAGAVSVVVRLTSSKLTASASNGAFIDFATTQNINNTYLGLRWGGADGAVSNVSLRRLG